MNFDGYFKFTSYAVVACGALALLASGGIGGIVTGIFALTMIFAWRLEGSKYQFSERFGLALIVLALPLYYLDWQYQTVLLPRERAGAATLAHLILGLSVIKLFQIKNDRDWVFLYLISFFEILLAAGLSISPSFLAILFLYLLFAVCTIIAFEIRKAGRSVKILELAVIGNDKKPKAKSLSWRLPAAAIIILTAISALAIPTFFMMPRVGGAGMGAGGGGGLSGFVGFSDSVNLGAIGTLQQSDAVVMRVQIETGGAAALRDLRWRGTALDFFDNQGWRNTLKRQRTTEVKNENGLIQVGTVKKADDLLIQTVYLEPLADSAALFGAPRIVAMQGGFSGLNRDPNGAITLSRNSERVVYKVYSDTSQPADNILRRDAVPYNFVAEPYLQLPEIDRRIPALAKEIINQSGAQNRLDAARAVERYLQTEFGYTLEMKAAGSQPVADFLFNIRAGHCEYFSSAMAIMLRSQGIATRVVNGFQTGEYNDAAGAYIVSQKDAHSWVEVYFPETDSWVTFDPTPAAGKNLSEQVSAANPVSAQINKYIEAMNMFWLQYVVAYDNQEQRSLARTIREQVMSNQERAQTVWQTVSETAKDWWKTISGARGAAASWQSIAQTAAAIILIIGLAVLFWFLGKRVSWQKIRRWFAFSKETDSRRIIEFYERMTRALAKKGVKREPSQTPLEFAFAVNDPEALNITEAYNRVRFGAHNLSPDETGAIENWLRNLEAKNQN